ncbi:hypothetical protein Tco_0009119 [Tanacetum coccineum]
MTFNKFNRLSRIDDDLYTYEVEVPKPTPCVKQRISDPTHNDLGEYERKMSYEECKKIYVELVIFINNRLIRIIDVTMEQWSYKIQFEEYLEIKRQRETYAREVDMEYNPSNLVFTEWLGSNFYNHLEMDWYSKNALRVYWMRGDDEVILSNKEVSNLKDKNNDYEHKITEIFMIETNLFDYETMLCTKFNEFNYLLKVDTKLFTHDVKRTYEDYKNEWNNEVDEPWSKDGVPYELCDHIYECFCIKNGKTKWPTCNSNEDGFYNGGE